MKEPDNFDVLKTMCDRNKDIALAVDLLNFDRKPKLKGGTITVGVADPHFSHLIKQAATGEQTHFAVLMIYNIKQFNEIKKELTVNK